MPSSPVGAVKETKDTAEPSHNGYHIEPRCRACRHDDVRSKVNDLLAAGYSYAMVLRGLAQENSALDACDQVTLNSIRNHADRHFPVQNSARATYREILERRAKEAGIDFVHGVATALTPIAYFETILVKSYESLVDSKTSVDLTHGMAAASRLQAFIESRAGQLDAATILARQNRIIDIMLSVVPEELRPEVLKRVDGHYDPSATSPTESLEPGDDDIDFDDEVDYDEFDDEN